MLKRLDNYIHAMTDKYAKYSDVIVSWDVVNEAVDDYSGQIRNADDTQVSQWGRIFRRPDLDGNPDARLYAESAWVRQAFESARKWETADGVHWKLYYNDYQDSDKLYEPKMSQTIKMLKPIHDAGNIDGYGMQGRLAWAYPSIAQLQAQIKAGLTVADEISITESDIRRDFEPNPDYDPSQPTRRGDRGRRQRPGPPVADLRLLLVGEPRGGQRQHVRRLQLAGPSHPGLGHARQRHARQQPGHHAQAGRLRGRLDGPAAVLQGQGRALRLGRHVGLEHVQPHRRRPLWSGLAGNPEKYSFFAMLGAPAREQMRAAIARVDTLVPATYAVDAWQKVARRARRREGAGGRPRSTRSATSTRSRTRRPR